MSVESEDGKVVSLEDFKNEKSFDENLAAHERGELFSFKPFELDRSDVPNGVGITECDSHPICMVLDKENLTGFSMSLETAEEVANDILGAVEEYKKHKAEQEKEGTDVRG